MISGFTISGYDDDRPEWSDFIDLNSIPDDKYWIRSNIVPNKGEYKIVNSDQSLKKLYPQRFWTLFSPALSFFNGWEDHPEEIEESSLACLEVSEEVNKNNGYWSRVEIIDAIAVKDVSSTLPEYSGATSHLERIQSLDVLEHTELNDEWFYFCGRDLDHDYQGNWILIHKRERKYHLVLYGAWDYSNEDRLYLGNVLLSEGFFNKLREHVKNA
ncbi:hypothetical protein [Bacterioplanoides sp.]|uniref:hypothetical protein n=1 Tax=Bacterioplanoides sp. TaxID=2066072 RepID=UPI003B594F5F